MTHAHDDGPHAAPDDPPCPHSPRNPTPSAPPPADPLLAPPLSMPESPLLKDEKPPLRPLGLLDVNPTSRRMENLDALRIVCMFVIILTHVTGPYLEACAGPYEGQDGLWVGDHPPAFSPVFRAVFSINVASRFGVPCFLMISFFIYWHQLYDKGRTWGELLARRFKRLVPAFVCWSLFYFLVYKAIEKFTGGRNLSGTLHTLNWKRAETWIDILIWGKAEYHLYYLPMVMQCLLLIPLLRVLWRRQWTSWGWISLTMLAWYTVLYGVRLFSPHTPAWDAAAWTSHAVNEETAPPLLIFPLFGMMCAGQRAWRKFIAAAPDKVWWAVLAAGIALHVGEGQWLLPYSFGQALAFLKLGRVVTAFACFVLFIRHPLMRDPLPRVSHYAFGLHFMHPFIILMLTLAEARLLSPAVAHWQAYVVPLLAVNLLLTLGITYALCRIIGRVRWLEFLVV